MGGVIEMWLAWEREARFFFIEVDDIEELPRLDLHARMIVEKRDCYFIIIKKKTLDGAARIFRITPN